MEGLDGEYWEVGDGPRSRKPRVLEVEQPLDDTPKKPRKKRAPLSEEKKQKIAEKMKKTHELRRIQSEILGRKRKMVKEMRMEYLQAKDCVQRDGIEIYDRVFVGGRLSAMNYDLLKERNVTGILNVSSEVRLYFSDTNEFEYKRISVDDRQEEPLINHFDDAVQFVSEQLNSDSNAVHIHCKMGQSRSCTIIVAFGMKCKGWDLKTTMQNLKAKHACVGINDGFKRQLMEYEKSLFGVNSMDFFCKRKSTLSSNSSSKDYPSQNLDSSFSQTLLNSNSLPLPMLSRELATKAEVPEDSNTEPNNDPTLINCDLSSEPTIEKNTPTIMSHDIQSCSTEEKVDSALLETVAHSNTSNQESLVPNRSVSSQIPSITENTINDSLAVIDNVNPIEASNEATASLPQQSLQESLEKACEILKNFPRNSSNKPAKKRNCPTSDLLDGSFWTSPTKRRRLSARV